jgi:CRP/FNR family transcriptional regulator, anaerobic regulatory protein
MNYNNLILNVKKYIDLEEDKILILKNYIRCFNVKKSEFLLKEGQVCRSMYFVEKGCLRMFFINKKSTEQITQFAIENWWLSDYFSIMDENPTDYYIQAIENSEILEINKLSYDELLIEIPQLEKYFRIIMQKAVAASQHRAKLQYQMSKEEFYQHFITSFPEFIQRVPQYMIASYLGLTPEYVSELRKKKQIF